MKFDLNDPGTVLRADVLDDPRPFHDQLRREAPIWQIQGQDSFLVSDPALIKEAVGRTEDFSSNIVSLLHDDGNGCPVPYRISNYGDPIHVFSTADPPEHTRHRRLVQPHLSPAAVAELEPEVERIIDEQLAIVLDTGRLDIVASFSDVVPARTVCALLGLPDGDSAKVIEYTLGTGALLDGVTTIDGMGAAATSAIELAVHMHQRMDEMLERASEDRVGMLGVFADQLDAGEVSRDEVSSMLTVFVTAGSETTASLMATCIETLARDRELQDRLRAQPELISNVIERILRDSGPFQFHYRYTPADTELGGVTIPAHSRVLLMWAAANRPAPDTLDEPAEFDLEARPAPHFAFGRGLHFCIGAPVARMETRLALERLLAASASITLDPDSAPTRRPSIFIRRHATLPVVIEKA